MRGPSGGGNDPNVERDNRIRTALRRAGYDVNPTGRMTRRAWDAFRHFQHHQGGVDAGKTSAHWNADNPRHQASDKSILDNINRSGVVRKTAKAGVALGKAVASAGKTAKAKKASGNIKGVSSAKGSTSTVHGKQQAPQANKGGGKGGGGSKGPALPGFTAPSLGGPGVNKLIGAGMADQIAGEQYDPQILELTRQLQRGRRDTAQAQADIGNWYGKVRSSQDTASQRDQAAEASARGSVSNEIQGILASLGGSRGAGTVAAQGVADLTQLAGAGQAQDEYNADLAPILSSEEAGQHSREQALASQAADKLNTALVGARGARGQAKVKAMLDILTANNQSRQQNFQNRLAIQNAALAAQSLGLDTAKTLEGIRASRATTRQNAKKLALESLAYQQKSGKPNFGKLNYPDRNTVVEDAVNRAAKEITQRPGENHWDPVHVTNSALDILRGGGYTSARKAGYKGPGVNAANQRIILSLLPRALARAHQSYNQQVAQLTQQAKAG